MTDDKEPYTPLSERVNQDVMHDNFVPKYSGLATAKPSLVVLAGVWMIFGTALVCIPLFTLPNILDAPDLFTAVIGSILPALLTVLAIAILVTQTRRYLHYKRESESESGPTSDDSDEAAD